MLFEIFIAMKLEEKTLHAVLKMNKNREIWNSFHSFIMLGFNPPLLHIHFQP